jgi:hypothetical protein
MSIHSSEICLILVRKMSISMSFAHSTDIVVTLGQKVSSYLEMARMKRRHQKMLCLPMLSKCGGRLSATPAWKFVTI